MDHRFKFESAAAPMPCQPMFHYKVRCPGDLVFDVFAVTAEDARLHVKRRHSKRIKSVELVSEVKRFAA